MTTDHTFPSLCNPRFVTIDTPRGPVRVIVMSPSRYRTSSKSQREEAAAALDCIRHNLWSLALDATGDGWRAAIHDGAHVHVAYAPHLETAIAKALRQARGGREPNWYAETGVYSLTLTIKQAANLKHPIFHREPPIAPDTPPWP